jgi:hypothetical protein
VNGCRARANIGLSVAFTSHLLASMVACLLCSVAHADGVMRRGLPDVKGSALPESHLLAADWYPSASVRLCEQGRGLVEFAISPTGRATDVSDVSSQVDKWTLWPARLEDAALRYVRALEFDVPSDWEASAKRRYRFSFIFLVRPSCCIALSCKEKEMVPPFPADYSLTVIAPPRPFEPPQFTPF